MTTYYKEDLKQDALDFLPESIRRALVELAIFQHETGIEISFDWLQPRPASSLRLASAGGPCIRLGNIPKKRILGMIKGEVRKRWIGNQREFPALFLQGFNLAGTSCLLWLEGDAEKRARGALEIAVKLDGRAYAEKMAEEIFKTGHPLGELDPAA